MSGKLRSGRNYDASKVSGASKRQRRKRKAHREARTKELKLANTETGEQTVVQSQVQLTFGTTSGVASDHGGGVVIVGTGKRRGIALDGGAGVKISLAAYIALLHRAPPTRKVEGWPTATPETREIADAPIEGEATAQSSVEAADRAPGAEDTAPGSAKCAPAAHGAPNTPTTSVAEPDLSLDVLVHAKPSRACNNSTALNGNRSLVLAKYVVDDNTSELPTMSSKRKKRCRRKPKAKRKAVKPDVSTSTESKSIDDNEGLTGDEEVHHMTCEDPYADPCYELPDEGEWVSPDGQSDYMSPLASLRQGHRIETNGQGVEVNALICDLDENYVYDDEEYANILRNLRERDRSETQSTRSKTRARPSRSNNTHGMTVEDVESDLETIATSRMQPYAGEDKGKPKPKKKSEKRNRPSLGMALDDLEGARERLTRPCEVVDTSMNYRGGGYFEQLVGSTPARESRGMRPSRRPSPWLEDRSSSRRDPSSPRRPPVPPRRPPIRSEPSDDDGSGSDGTHTPSSEGSANSSDESESEVSLTETRTNTTVRSADRRADRNRRLEKMVRKLKRKNKRLEKKLITQARSGYKAQTPEPYKGEADIDRYDIFIFNYKLFVDDTKLSDRKAVLTMSRFLEDKAAMYFMLNVAPCPEQHTMQSVFVGLYEYCFPPDFKEAMRHEFNGKRQGKLSVQDYFAELARLRMRLREINDRQYVLRAWDGAAQYIKVGWALKGISAETADVDTLRKFALDVERARRIKRSIEKSGNDEYDSQESVSQSSRDSDNRSIYRSDKDFEGNQSSSDKDSAESESTMSESHGSISDSEPGEPGGGRNNVNESWRRITEEEKAQLRAARLCFQCEKPGHISRYCPNLQKLRIFYTQPDTTDDQVRISSVMLKELDELVRLKARIERNSRCSDVEEEERVYRSDESG